MADDRMSGNEMRQRLRWGAGIAIGMGVGVAMGSALDNMGAGIAIGIAIGIVFAIAIGSVGKRRKPRGDDESADEDDSVG
ncbi:hypothetical protein ACTU6V_14820 [Microbacterium sp. A204]|uniref:hypothetical protein n=1 Tax=Microbacterium sp. A204 TaxID=3457321 RepID=UPI003FD3A6A1